jgi:hypothetical protein
MKRDFTHYITVRSLLLFGFPGETKKDKRKPYLVKVMVCGRVLNRAFLNKKHAFYQLALNEPWKTLRTGGNSWSNMKSEGLLRGYFLQKPLDAELSGSLSRNLKMVHRSSSYKPYYGRQIQCLILECVSSSRIFIRNRLLVVLASV